MCGIFAYVNYGVPRSQKDIIVSHPESSESTRATHPLLPIKMFVSLRPQPALLFSALGGVASFFSRTVAR